ncbi:MAG: hypothetical protein AAFW00_14185 [Bacteroidota bacterium]
MFNDTSALFPSFPSSAQWMLVGGMVLILFYYGSIYLRIYVRRNEYMETEVVDPYDLSPPLMHIIYHGKASVETLLINFFYAVSRGSHSITYKKSGRGFVLTYQSPEAWKQLDPATKSGLGFNGIPLPKISVRSTISKMTHSLFEELAGRLERQASPYLFNKRRVILMGMGITLLYSLLMWGMEFVDPLQIKVALYLVLLTALVVAMFLIVLFTSNRFGNLGRAVVLIVGCLTFCTFGWGFGGNLVLVNILLLYANLIGLWILPEYSSKGIRLKEKLSRLREALKGADEHDPQQLPYMLALDINCRTLILIRGLYQTHHTQGDGDRGSRFMDFHPY